MVEIVRRLQMFSFKFLCVTLRVTLDAPFVLVMFRGGKVYSAKVYGCTPRHLPLHYYTRLESRVRRHVSSPWERQAVP